MYKLPLQHLLEKGDSDAMMDGLMWMEESKMTCETQGPVLGTHSALGTSLRSWFVLLQRRFLTH